MFFNFLFAGLIGVFAAGCTSSSSGNSSNQAALVAPNLDLSVVQNSAVSVDLGIDGALEITLTKPANHGVVSIKGTVATYRLNDPLFSGDDSFSYVVSKGGTSSNEAIVNIAVSKLPAGNSTFTETYVGSQYALSNWRAYTSSFGHTSNSVTGFATANYNGVTMPSRHFGVYGDATAFAGAAFYNDLFSVLPVDGTGAAMMDWPWKAELIHVPECGCDATITMKLVSNLGQYPMGSILLNYDIDRDSSDRQRLTGYQVFFNSGGGSLTLSRFNQAHELATAYMDRWPNTSYGNEAMANPISSGPYKGWNYRNGLWPAGGNVGVGTNLFLAARYQYNPSTKETVISYEARGINGVDGSPGTWDNVVTLTGTDSLPSGGSFGIAALNYHTTTMHMTTDFDITEYKMVCSLP